MPDDPSKRGKPDRDRVSQQPHEVRHIVKQTGKPAPLVKKIIEQVGPSRQKVVEKLKEMDRNKKR